MHFLPPSNIFLITQRRPSPTTTSPHPFKINYSQVCKQPYGNQSNYSCVFNYISDCKLLVFACKIFSPPVKVVEISLSNIYTNFVSTLLTNLSGQEIGLFVYLLMSASQWDLDLTRGKCYHN